jgi:predicted Zn-dependent protease
MRKLSYLCWILFILFYLIACESEQLQAPCRSYDFADGLYIEDFHDRSCYDGELGGKQMKEISKWYERQLKGYSDKISARELERAAQKQKSGFDHLYEEVRGEKANKVKYIFRRLRDHTRRRDLYYDIKVVRSVKTPGEVNAWVTYDGTIYLTNALINFVDTDDELAFCIAHEICHVENLLPDQMLARDFALDAFLGENTLKGMFKNAMDNFLSGLNQRYEIIADRAALYLMHEAGFDPERSLDFFAKLNTLEEKDHNWGAIKQFWRTHPYSNIRFNCLNSYLYESRTIIPNCNGSKLLTSL